MTAAFHPGLAAGGWGRLSLVQQLGNVGSEVSRARRWKDKDARLYDQAVIRALELLDLTLRDPRWSRRRKELARARDMVCDAWLGGREYGSDWPGLDRYFLHFAFAARK
ncbi:MAG: hypothetical protein PHF00_08645 [Elusimicrobia bacterium]|nr:hypothetical protein [Elusimicrobiota bacterium]